MTAIDITTLEASVEALIRQQVAEYDARLRAALGRRLAPAGDASSSPRKKPRRTPSAKHKRARTPAPRRSAAELDALGERFLEAVEATPGETMANLAARLQVSGTALGQPMVRLKREGLIKTVGYGGPRNSDHSLRWNGG